MSRSGTSLRFRRRTVAQQLADQLSLMIKAGHWQRGSQLPTLRQLAEQYDVSINSAQESLQLLAERGLVDLRPRQGAFVDVEVASEDRKTDRRQIAVVWLAATRQEVEAAGAGVNVEQENTWQSRITRAFELTLLADAGEWHHVSMPFVAGEEGLQSLFRRLDAMRDSLAGVLCYSWWGIDPVLAALDERGIPWVTVNPPSRQSRFNFVAADNFGGGQRVGRCLLALGLERVLMLGTETRPGSSSADKMLGLYQAFLDQGGATAGLAVERCGGTADQEGYKATQRYLKAAGKPPEAVFAMGDFLALGAVQALREAGLRVPEDVGVVGATGLSLAAYSSPPLTVLAQPMEELGRYAAEMLLGMTQSGKRRMVGRRSASPLIFRQSLAVPDGVRDEMEQMYQRETEELGAGRAVVE